MYTLTKREADEVAAFLGVKQAGPALFIADAHGWLAALSLHDRQARPCVVQGQRGLAGRVGSYHSDLSVQRRRDVHAAFMHDELQVRPALVAPQLAVLTLKGLLCLSVRRSSWQRWRSGWVRWCCSSWPHVHARLSALALTIAALLQGSTRGTSDWCTILEHRRRSRHIISRWLRRRAEATAAASAAIALAISSASLPCCAGGACRA